MTRRPLPSLALLALLGCADPQGSQPETTPPARRRRPPTTPTAGPTGPPRPGAGGHRGVDPVPGLRRQLDLRRHHHPRHRHRAAARVRRRPRRGPLHLRRRRDRTASADAIGVRLRGKIGSFRTLSGKPKFKIDFNQYVEDQRFYGLETLSLNNAIVDCSYLKEAIVTGSSRPSASPPAHRLRAGDGQRRALRPLHPRDPGRPLPRSCYTDPTGNYDGKYVYYGGGSYRCSTSLGLTTSSSSRAPTSGTPTSPRSRRPSPSLCDARLLRPHGHGPGLGRLPPAAARRAVGRTERRLRAQQEQLPPLLQPRDGAHGDPALGHGLLLPPGLPVGPLLGLAHRLHLLRVPGGPHLQRAPAGAGDGGPRHGGGAGARGHRGAARRPHRRRGPGRPAAGVHRGADRRLPQPRARLGGPPLGRDAGILGLP